MAENLTQSPMYNLSLSDKELFHSNFLAWLGNNDDTKPFFLKVIKKLSGIDLNQYDNWTVLREYKNFDLCIIEKIKEEGKEDIIGYRYILVIENKVKSIPRKDQLDKYVGKIKELNVNKDDTKKLQFLLLTLANEFPDKKSIVDEKIWKIKTYKDLAAEMEKQKDSVQDQYHKSLIKDYIEFINNLNDLVKKWQENKEFANNDDLGELNKISDLRAKIQFSSYCEKLKEKIRNNISGIVVFDNNDVKDKEFANKIIDKNKLYIYVDWGYSSRGKTGLIDIAIPVTKHGPSVKLNYGCYEPEYVIKIQVEGDSYRHVIEMFKKQNDLNLVALGQNEPYTGDGGLEWFCDPQNKQSKVNYGNNDLFEKGLYPQSKNSLKNKAAWPFKSYNSTFIYQSKKINESAKVDDVLNNIVGEVERVLVWLSE